MSGRRWAVATAVAAALIVPERAPAAVFKVTAAHHFSSSQKDESDYSGRSSTTWRLARATRTAPNRLTVQRVGRLVAGSATVNVRGEYGISATTPQGRCAWVARTGDRAHALVAPRTVALSVGPHPDDARRTVVTFTGVHASLVNPYLGSECSTSAGGEPAAEETSLRAVPKAVFGRKRFTVRFSGATNRDGIAYRWSTSFRFTRVRR